MLNYYNLGQLRARLALGFTKEALTRLDRELQKGTITPADVVPGTSPRAAQPGATGAPARRGMRNKLVAPSSAPPEQLERLREMRARLAQAQMKRPDVALGLPSGKNLRVVQDAAKMRTPAATMGGSADTVGPSLWLRNTRQRGEMFMPQNEEFELQKVQRSPKLRAASKLPTVQHELGEFEQYLGKDLLPFSTHVGTNPNMREKFHTTGDPVIHKEFATARANSPDDVIFEKLYRQMGGTPDSPLPLHGRQHAALNKQMAQRASEFSPEAKLTGLHHASGKLVADKGKYNVPYVTPEALQDYESAAPKIKSYLQGQANALPTAAKSPNAARTLGAITKGREQAVQDAVPKRLLKFLGLRSPSQLSNAFKLAT